VVWSRRGLLRACLSSFLGEPPPYSTARSVGQRFAASLVGGIPHFSVLVVRDRSLVTRQHRAGDSYASLIEEKGKVSDSEPHEPPPKVKSSLFHN